MVLTLWAVMDIGTNSSRLLVAEYNRESGKLQTFRRELRTTRIGLGMTEGNSYLSPEGINRTLQALTEFSDVLKHYPVEQVVVLATQAVRVACNQEELAEKIKVALGWDLQIISGEEEARLSYLGAMQGLVVTGVPVVIDIGGGSTEFIRKEEKDHKTYQVHSLPLGALRLWENPLSDEKIRRLLAEGLADFSWPQKVSLVGVGGTVTTVAAVQLGLLHYVAEKVQGLKISITEIRALYQKLKEMPPEARLQLAGITPGREDIIVAGLQILINIMDYGQVQQITVSDQDLLVGTIINQLLI
ncbi:MAG: Ppx/GppA family phosphatase [Peptococcia bacterium]|jgi:exopolyphosphatase/guanosine-5'-triphosphate,3'-diphosphate pyrophosphatase